MTKEINIQITYVKNLLRSLSYLAIQRLRFLEIILSKLLRLDVRLIIHSNFSINFSIKFLKSKIGFSKGEYNYLFGMLSG